MTTCKPAQAVAPKLPYSAHVSTFGWESWVSNGAITGTTGRGLVQIKFESKVAAFNTGGVASKIYSGNPGNTAISGSSFQYLLTKAYIYGNE